MVQRITRARLLVASLIGLASCGGGGRGAVLKAGSQVEVVVPTMDAGNPVAAEVVAVVDGERQILEYVPGAYGLILHLSLAKVEASEFFGRHESTLLRTLGEQRQRVVKLCQFAPMIDISTVTLGIDLRSKNSTGVLLVLSTSVGATRIEDCVRALGGKTTPDHYELDGDKFGYYWPAEDVLLLSGESNSEELVLALRSGRALDNPSLMQLLSRADRHATLWGAGSIPRSIAGAIAGLAGAPTGFVVRGSLWAGLDVSLELSFASKDDAAGMMKMLGLALKSSGQSSPFKELVAAIEFEQLDTVLRVDVQLSPDLAAALLKQLL
ncbi:MAG: hypothetical protein GY811_12375 [Myxococcales bacterium]|nr:hypothetical protein [Myxococcales bacterium]